MKITSRPLKDSEGNPIASAGDLNVILPIPKEIINELDGRPKAYFYALVRPGGEVKIFGEAKNVEEW